MTNLERRLNSPSPGNPAGVSIFDAEELARLVEYQSALRALDALTRATAAAGYPISQGDWLDVVRNATAAIPFVDSCERCAEELPRDETLIYPAKTHGGFVYDDIPGMFRAFYECTRCHNRWHTDWHTQTPDVF